MLQYQESANFKRISRQIQARKECIENVSIQPFRSHRKRKEQCDVLMPLHSIDDNKPEEFQKTKLNREYPPLSSINATDTKKHEGYKYNFNQLTHSIATEGMPSKQAATKLIESQPLVNRFSSGIKRNTLLENPFTINSQIQRNEVKSIIFDSKVEPFLSKYSTPSVQEIQQQNDLEINSFKEKVDKVNNQIQAGINNLEKMVERLKQRKISESLLKSNTIQARFQSEANQVSQPIKVATIAEVKQLVPAEAENAFDFTLKKQVKRQLKAELEPSRSQMQLTGEFKSKLGKFPPQYTTFINRLAHQINIDMEFTNMISEVTRSNQLPKIRNLILKEMKNQYQVEVDESFLVIEPSQMDPLEVSKPYFIHTKPKEQEETELVKKICKKYLQIQVHFDTKLHKKSDNTIIKLLFEELAKFNSTKKSEQVKSVTVGHLLSYLNMRTNKSFRNRYFVKLAKRLQLKPGSNLSIQSFTRLTL